MWMVTEIPTSSQDLPMQQEMARLRSELAVTREEVLEIRYGEEERLQQTRREDEQQMYEQLSAQARDVVAYHERTTRANEEQ